MLNTVELFAGVGGFRIGLEKSEGLKVAWGNQWEPSKKRQDAFDCYATRFKGEGIHSNENISNVDADSLGDETIDLIAGGFPCQDYSVARSLSSEKGIQGKKGVLFWEIIRLLKDLQPKYILLENVDRLLKSPSKQKGRDFSIMLASFRDEGYNVEWRVINAADYGNAQRRRRVFIFASRKDLPFNTHLQSVDASQLLHHNGYFAPIFPVEESVSTKKTPHTFVLPSDIVDVSDTFSMEYRNSGYMRDGQVHTEEVTPVYEKPIHLGEILEQGVAEKYYLSPEKLDKFKYLKGAKRIPRTSASGHSYVYTEGAVAFPDPLNKPSRTMLTSEGSTNRSTHVVKDPETDRLRLLTPVECERLNGFPDNWTEGMSERMRYFCMGNALVIGLIERMGKRIKELERVD